MQKTTSGLNIIGWDPSMSTLTVSTFSFGECRCASTNCITTGLLCFFPPSDSPGTVLVDNVGYCLPMANGRKVVLPSTHAKSLPYPMKNTVGYQPKCEKFMDPLDLSSITFSHYKYPTAELIAFLRGMPTPLPESTSCAKYYFEAGHRKVT